MNKKGFLDISFSWIFAFIIGGFIIFGAVYGLNSFTKTEQSKSSAETGTEFGNILNTFETSSESATSVPIEFPVESRLVLGCSQAGELGKQKITIDEKINNKWSDTGLAISLKNKYIFSEDFIEGKKFYVFSKPLEFPFKVANLVYLTKSEETYCFIDPPRQIKSEIKDLTQENLLTKDCKDTATVNICFDGGSNCDIEVNYNGGFVEKDNNILPFEGDSMMYGAIFSDSGTYECVMKRLMARANVLTNLYKQKSLFMVNRCDSGLVPDLIQFSTLLDNYRTTESLLQLTSTKAILESKNKYSDCKLW